MVKGRFLDAHTRTDEKENHERFRKEINDACENHECHVIRLEYGELPKTLEKGRDH